MSENQVRIIFQGDTKDFDKKLKDVGSKLDKFNKRASQLGKTLSTRLTLPLAVAGGAAIKLASDFNESLNKVDVAFGSSQKQVKEFAKTTLDQFGIAEGSALDMAALFGDMATSMGFAQDSAASMSTELVGLAGDLASFKNIDIEQATTALAGVFTGETESLKRLGIVMTEVNLQQFAMSKGLDKSVKKMTQAEKVALRYEFIMSKTANAQGDFARTGGGAANQMRVFQESLKELGAEFGQVMLPAFTELVKKLNGVLKVLGNLSPEMKGIITAFAGLAAAVGPLLYSVPKLTKFIKLLTTAARANPILAVASALLAVGTAIVEIGRARKQAKIDEFNESISKMGEDEALAKLKSLNKALEENNKIIQGSATIAAKSTAKKENKEIEEKIKLTNDLINTIRSNAQAARELNAEIERSKTLNEGVKTQQVEMTRVEGLTLERKKVFNYVTGESSEIVTGFAGSLQEAAGALNIVGTVLTENVAPPLESMKEKVFNLDQLMNTLGQETTYALMDAFMSLGTSEKFFDVLVKSIGRVIKQLIAAAAVAFLLNTLLGGTGLGKKLGMGDGGIDGFKGIFGKLTGIKLAKGGIVNTPTLATIGEYPGAKTNPEVVAPLDKLQGMIGQSGGHVQVGGEFRIKGQDLVVALQRADRNRNRIK